MVVGGNLDTVDKLDHRTELTGSTIAECLEIVGRTLQEGGGNLDIVDLLDRRSTELAGSTIELCTVCLHSRYCRKDQIVGRIGD